MSEFDIISCLDGVLYNEASSTGTPHLSETIP